MVTQQQINLQRQRAGALLQVRQRKLVTRTHNAPVGGWNTRDSIGDMARDDAIVMTNMFPDLGNVVARKGHTSHATGVGSSNVETLASYEFGGTRKLLAWGGGTLYDATSTGAATSLQTGYNNSRFHGVNFNAQFHFVNNSDVPQQLDDATVTQPAWTGSGLTLSNLAGVAVSKERLFFWEGASADFWYASVQAVSGTLTKFPLSFVHPDGGGLVAIDTLTVDGGVGIEDLTVFFMEDGTAIVYAGTDPGDASNWTQLGKYKIGRPVHQRAIQKIGGDLFVVTDLDYVSFTIVVKSRKLVITQTKLSGAARDAVKSHGSNFGWDVTLYPQGKQLIVTVPEVTNGRYVQHVINTVTGAACKFTGQQGRSWVESGGKLYFGGGSGVVFQADNGQADNGAAIDIELQTAWNNMGLQGPKSWKQMKPVLDITGNLTLKIAMGTDFGPMGSEYSTTYTTSGTTWDAATSLWDVSSWSSENLVQTEWQGLVGQGEHISVRLKASISSIDLSLDHLHYAFERLGRVV